MLQEKDVRRALLHLTSIGDTDIFPAPFEYHFYRETADKIVSDAAKVDFGNFRPRGAVELLTPDPFAGTYLKWLKGNQEHLYEKIREDFKVQSRSEKIASEFSDLFGDDEDLEEGDSDDVPKF